MNSPPPATALEADIMTPPHALAHIPGRTPGQWAMWVFVLGDMFIFAGWFSFYMFFRMKDRTFYLRSEETLDQTIGVLNTLILLFSSWMIARCVYCVQRRKYKASEGYTWLALASGALFVASKVVEWTREVAAGHAFETNYFYMFYYFLTGVHVFHVLIGLIVLGVVIREVRIPALRSQEVVETGATYWHMVDFLWVIIFALLYLMR
jgi:nitric oxide reductase NorE protein